MKPIVLLGVPGAGKGTQAKRIAQRYSIPHLSTGDIFREMASSGSELGARVWADMTAGNLVSDALVCQVVGERLQRADCSHGYILDGFPRTLPQASWLIDIAWKRPEQSGRPLPAIEAGPPATNGSGQAKSGEPLQFGGERPRPGIVIYLTVGYNDLYRRLLGRRSCPKCGRIYNDFTQPPRRAGVCDLDGTPLVQRKDDDPAVIRERLSAYEEQTLPLVNFFRSHLDLLEISGAEPVDRVSERVFAALDAVEDEKASGGRA